MKDTALSIKENVEAIKDGLNSEEKLFETVVIVEKFYKKYKLIIWAVAAATIAYFIISSINALSEEDRIKQANAAFTVLSENAHDEKALKTLKSNSKALYDLHRFQEAMKTSDVATLKSLRKSKAFAIADMSKYQYAMLSGDSKALVDYIDGGAVYFKDIAILNAAANYIKQSNLKAAKKLLSQIDSRSPFFEQASTLMHFGITK